jgi:ABC-2 type transport system permease protein
MNAQSNAMGDAVVSSARVSAETLPPKHPFLWSVRREFWESRSIYLAPTVVSGLIIVGFLIRAIAPAKLPFALAIRNPEQGGVIHIVQPYNFAAFLLMGTTLLVAIFYSLDALYGERRDRSILFWKSLPVSDTTAVLSKAVVPIVIIPLLTFAFTVVTQLVMLLINVVALLAMGLSVAKFWAGLSLFHLWGITFYHLVTGHALWYAPIFAYLLLVSAWARRAPFLWATLPLLAISVLEKITFNTLHFANMLATRFAGGADNVSFSGGDMPLDPMIHLTPGRFFSAPGLWTGLAAAAIFLLLAIRLRRYRGPI